VFVARNKGIRIEEQRARRLAGIPVGRDRTIAEAGAACTSLCSQQAGSSSARVFFSTVAT